MEKDLLIAFTQEICITSPEIDIIIDESDSKTIIYSDSPLGKAKLFFFNDFLYAGIIDYKGEGYILTGEIVHQIY